MDFKFSKDAEQPQQPNTSAEKGNQGVLLIVLLILVAGFAYIYLFTGLIRPLPEQKQATPPAPSVVKNPLPPRVSATAPTPAESPKIAQATPPTAAKEASKPSEKKPLPAISEKALPKPATAAVDRKQPVKDKKSAVTSATTADKVSATAQRDMKPKPSNKDITSTVGTTRPAKTIAATDKKSLNTVEGGPWMLVVGNYLIEDAMAVDMARLRKAGFAVSVQPGVRKTAQMNRLFLAEYTDRDKAQADMSKLKRYTSDAFILEQNGKFAVYAGSYLLDTRVASEKERLAAAGFSMTLKRTEVAIPSKALTAGSFTDKNAAETALKKLENAGIKATLTRQ